MMQTCPSVESEQAIRHNVTQSSPPSTGKLLNGFLGAMRMDNVLKQPSVCNGNGLPNIADMERKLREAKAEKERLLRARVSNLHSIAFERT
ncbi:UNVERIFIED_CONTAM: hypothetical protein FKN15_069256 [Acipenser sinensis]